MSRRDDDVTLRQMLVHIEETIALATGRTQEDLDSDRVFFLATLKLVEIVGEAASRVSDSFKAAHSEIPWRQIVGTRNRLVHGYDVVDLNILWEIVSVDFPSLALRVRALVKT